MMNKEQKKAFTIVEMLVATAIISIISLIISGVFSSGNKQYKTGLKRIDLNEKAALAERDFEMITRGATGIISAESDNLSFYTYLIADTHPAPSKINYYLDNGILYRSSIAPVSSDGNFIYPESSKIVKKVTDNVVGTDLFTYFNDANIELSFPVQSDVVRMIRMSITIDDDINRQPESAIQSTAVELRNLKNNL